MTEKRKAKTQTPYVVGSWNEGGAFVPCEKQPEAPISQFDEIVRWTLANLGKAPGAYSFVRKDPRTFKVTEQTTIKGTLVELEA